MDGAQRVPGAGDLLERSEAAGRADEASPRFGRHRLVLDGHDGKQRHADPRGVGRRVEQFAVSLGVVQERRLHPIDLAGPRVDDFPEALLPPAASLLFVPPQDPGDRVPERDRPDREFSGRRDRESRDASTAVSQQTDARDVEPFALGKLPPRGSRQDLLQIFDLARIRAALEQPDFGEGLEVRSDAGVREVETDGAVARGGQSLADGRPEAPVFEPLEPVQADDERRALLPREGHVAADRKPFGRREGKPALFHGGNSTPPPAFRLPPSAFRLPPGS